MSGAEYVGAEVMQDYILRFNETIGSGRKFADWHDSLYWVPDIQKLEPAEARAVLGNEDFYFVRFEKREAESAM